MNLVENFLGELKAAAESGQTLVVTDRLTVASFFPHVGSAFVLVEGGASLTLVKVVDGGPAPTAELPAPFTLEFSGDVVLEQATHRLEHPVMGALDIFLVRTALSNYEAVFA